MEAADHSRDAVLTSGGCILTMIAKKGRQPAPARSFEPSAAIFQWSAHLRAWAVARCHDGTVYWISIQLADLVWGAGAGRT